MLHQKGKKVVYASYTQVCFYCVCFSHHWRVWCQDMQLPVHFYM